MLDFNWHTILGLNEEITFESIGLDPDEQSQGVVEIGDCIHTRSQACHTGKGLRYQRIKGYIWAERLANAKKIVTYAPYHVERGGMLPPDLLKPYNCGWSYDEMFEQVNRDVSNPLLLFNWDGEKRVLEFSTDLKKGFCQMEFPDCQHFDGKLIGVGKMEFWYERGDLSAPYAVHYRVIGDVLHDH